MHIGDMQLIISQACVNLPDPNTKLANSNSLTLVLYYFDVFRIDSIYPFGYLLNSNAKTIVLRHINSVVFRIMSSQLEPLFTKCMVECGYFTHSRSSYR